MIDPLPGPEPTRFRRIERRVSVVGIHLDVPLWWVYNHHKQSWTGPVKVCEAVAISGIRPIALTKPTEGEGSRRWVDEGYAERDRVLRMKLLQQLKDRA